MLVAKKMRWRNVLRVLKFKEAFVAHLFLNKSSVKRKIMENNRVNKCLLDFLINDEDRINWIGPIVQN